MPYVQSTTVCEIVRQVLEEHFDKRRLELDAPASTLPPVAKWLTEEFGFPEDANRGDYPKGIVLFDRRTSERREQDTGETAVLDVTIRVYFSQADLTKDAAKVRAVAYGDALLYTLMREAKVVRPKDGTVIPGLFRIWPKTMHAGVFEEMDLMGAEVEAEVTVDSSFTAAV